MISSPPTLRAALAAPNSGGFFLDPASDFRGFFISGNCGARPCREELPERARAGVFVG